VAGSSEQQTVLSHAAKDMVQCPASVNNAINLLFPYRNSEFLRELSNHQVIKKDSGNVNNYE
jgi:hypothetical protein